MFAALGMCDDKTWWDLTGPITMWGAVWTFMGSKGYDKAWHQAINACLRACSLYIPWTLVCFEFLSLLLEYICCFSSTIRLCWRCSRLLDRSNVIPASGLNLALANFIVQAPSMYCLHLAFCRMLHQVSICLVFGLVAMSGRRLPSWYLQKVATWAVPACNARRALQTLAFRWACCWMRWSLKSIKF